METAQLKFYYKNVTAEVLGKEHGITKEQFDELAKKTAPLIEQLDEQRKAGKARYRDLPYQTEMAKSVRNVADSVKGCENFVVLGIGGSALGNTALQTALNPYMYNLDEKQRKGSPWFFVLDNVDPQQLKSFLDWDQDKLDKTVFNVISKSGRTAETAAQFLTICSLLEQRIGKDRLKERIIATTDVKEGTLRKITEQFGFRNLPVPDGVGGRFSVLSAVGLLSAAVCGIDIESLLAGAAEMDKKVSLQDFYQNPAAVIAAINWHYYNRGKRISVMMPYSFALKDFADWYRQLWAESLGKTKDTTGREVFVGPTPVKALGVTDQHSQVQLYREGPNDKLFTFLSVQDFGTDVEIGKAPDIVPELDYLSGQKMSRLINSEKTATEYALLASKRPCLTVAFDKICPYTVGQFIYLFETATSLAGLLFNINAYDQPAVELGKDATLALMGSGDYAQLAEKIKPFEQMDSRFII
ncbi:MAG: glucose-6-phosphate isomerase [Planctomycetes bacterium HGW-Planctomycetes-1]|nr:MAG: glucose-6-phosphate isomerase [Planctomycetes bacterium HGW-Planctomycetes-1]